MRNLANAVFQRELGNKWAMAFFFALRRWRMGETGAIWKGFHFAVDEVPAG
jgi:hypothetical protein